MHFVQNLSVENYIVSVVNPCTLLMVQAPHWAAGNAEPNQPGGCRLPRAVERGQVGKNLW